MITAIMVPPGLTPTFPTGIYGLVTPDSRIRFFRFTGPDSDGWMRVHYLSDPCVDTDVSPIDWYDFAFVAEGKIMSIDESCGSRDSARDLATLLFLTGWSAGAGDECILVPHMEPPEGIDAEVMGTAWLKLSSRGGSIRAIYVAFKAGLVL